MRLYGIEKCDELVQSYTQKAIEQLEVFRDHEELAALARSLTERMK